MQEKTIQDVFLRNRDNYEEGKNNFQVEKSLLCVRKHKHCCSNKEIKKEVVVTMRSHCCYAIVSYSWTEWDRTCDTGDTVKVIQLSFTFTAVKNLQKRARWVTQVYCTKNVFCAEISFHISFLDFISKKWNLEIIQMYFKFNLALF